MISMKSMDFVISVVAIIVGAPPQAIGELNAPQKRTFRECLKTFEMNFHVYLALGGRSLPAASLVRTSMTIIIEFH